VSFIIGHRGLGRLPLLLTTLECIAGQRGVALECLVVEQSPQREVEDKLPSWVRYVHAPMAEITGPYCRARAFNIGAQLSRGAILVLHDNDLLVPQDYAAELATRCAEGYEVINLKRFIFYLTESHSHRITARHAFSHDEAPESIMQNAQGGGSLAITRKAYFSIGGFDEDFVGWGGEDNKFWERAQTRNVWSYGYLPLLHLWHEAQPGKFAQERRAAELLELRSSIQAEKRIAELRERNFQGHLAGVGS
jgi:hypothetical protein